MILINIIVFLSLFGVLQARNHDYEQMQKKKIDSLLALLQNKDDTSKFINVHIELAEIYSKKDLDSSIYHSNKGLELLKNDTSNVNLTAKLYEVRSKARMFKGYYDLALEDLLRSVDIYQRLKDDKNEAMVFGKIAALYIEIRDYKKSKEYFSKAREYYDSISPDDKSMLDYFSNAAVLYGLLDDDQAIDNYKKALDLAKRLNSLEYLSNAYMDLASQYSKVGNNGFAFLYFDSARTIAKKGGLEFALAMIDLNYGVLLSRIGDDKKALKILNKSELYFNVRDKRALENVYVNLISIYEEKGDRNNQILYLNKLMELKDSLYRDEAKAKMAEYESSRMRIVKDDEIFSLKKNQKQQNNLNYALIATGLIFILIIGLEYKSYKSKSRSAKELNVLNKGLAHSNEKLKEHQSELKNLNDTKDRFFSIIAHDLKNPIGNLKNALEVLSSDYKSFSDDDLGEFLSELDESAGSVFELLENLLHWSRSQRGKIELNSESSDINYVVGSNVSLLKQMADQKNIKLYSNIKEPQFAFFDNNTISTVIRNLMSNAIKFTPNDGEIFVDAEVQDSELKISVCDSGVGISEENIKKLFRVDEKFSTQGTSGEAGTGLGLILCQDFVEKNKGKIWAESEFGKGSQFIFTLPISKNT